MKCTLGKTDTGIETPNKHFNTITPNNLIIAAKEKKETEYRGNNLLTRY